MTREEAITVLKGLSDNPLFSDQHRAAFNIAIHDIKAHYDWAINNLILINKDNYEPLEQEPKTGHWIFVGEENEEETKAGNFRYVCSECGFSDVHGKSTYVPYCWQCGAKMAESEADSGNDDN